MKYLVSIIVPCYNQVKFLPETLQTVLDQAHSDWECIIVNDGSIDDTEKVAKEWLLKDTRFRYLSKQNGGLSSARNAGIEIAKGEIILPLDADDKIASTYLQKIILGFQCTKNCKLVFCNVTFFGSKTGNYKLPKYNYKTLLIQNCFIACSAFKKSDWKKSGGYDENLSSFEDWDFWIRILNKDSIVHKIEETLFYYRKHEQGSLTNKFSSNKQYYYNLYDKVYLKNKSIYDQEFGNPIIAFQENVQLKKFKEKVMKLWIYKMYIFIKKLLLT